jgi:serine protease AprX
MAGIIAGNDPSTGFQGIAPDAGLVSVKVGASNGAVDVSQVIAAIDWVIEHRTSNGLNIRVLSLSYGTDGTQPYEIDPLMHAAERAWDAGIVVVVSAGNEGNEDGQLTNPARDPFVIAVGAADQTGTWKVETTDFTSSGNLKRYPDVLAPGVSIESLRAPGSWADLHHPEAVVDDELVRGTGSSQSAAIVSGAVALLLEVRPDLTPDQVKDLLKTTATSAQGSWKSSGHGMIDVAAAAAAPAPGDKAIQTFARSTGEGTLEGARGTHHVVLDGVILEGEVTFTGEAWDGASWGGASWGGASWGGASWGGASWGGASWGGASWRGASWGGASWGGASWRGASWGGASWRGASWGGATWG